MIENLLQLSVLATGNLANVLRVDSLLGEVDQNSPAPLLLALASANTDAEESAGHEEGDDVFRTCHNFANLVVNFIFVFLQFTLLANGALVCNLAVQTLELGERFGEFSL